MKKISRLYPYILLCLSTYISSFNYAWADVSLAKNSEQLKFESYPAGTSKTSDTPTLKLNSKLAKHYKTAITEASKEPANFAGHYRVATWGCGTDCHGFAIINKQTGNVYTLPDVNYVVGVMGNDDERVAYKVNSRLLVLRGALNDEYEGVYYYVWTGEKLKFLTKLNIVKENLSQSE